MTIKLCTQSYRKRDDGRFTIYFSFAHNGKTKFAASDVTIASPANFKNGQIVKEPNANYNNVKLNQQLIDYQRKYDALPDWQRELPLAQIIELLRENGHGKNASFADFAHKVIDDYKRRGQRSFITKEYALTKWKAKFDMLPLQAITKHTLDDFIEYLREQKLGSTTISICLREVKSIYHKAQEERLVSRDDDPFFKYAIPKWESRSIALTIEQIKRIRDAALQNKQEQIARDVFMLIFYLGGVNFIDLIKLKPIAEGRIIYDRQKTSVTKKQNIPVSLAVQPELMPYIEKYKGTDTLFDFGYNYTKYTDFRGLINHGLKKVAAQAGISANLTTYVARHSFATIADELGVSIDTIEYILGQSAKGRVVFQYMHRRNKAADEAMRVVLDALIA